MFPYLSKRFCKYEFGRWKFSEPHDLTAVSGLTHVFVLPLVRGVRFVLNYFFVGAIRSKPTAVQNSRRDRQKNEITRKQISWYLIVCEKSWILMLFRIWLFLLGSWFVELFCVCYSTTLDPDIHTHGLICKVLFTSLLFASEVLVYI